MRDLSPRRASTAAVTPATPAALAHAAAAIARLDQALQNRPLTTVGQLL